MDYFRSVKAFDKKTTTSTAGMRRRVAFVCSLVSVVLFSTTAVSQVTWNKAASPSFFTVRGGHRMVAHDTTLFIFSGQSEGQSVSTNAFCTSDGKNWTFLADTAGFRRGSYYGCVSFNKHIWVTGGAEITNG